MEDVLVVISYAAIWFILFAVYLLKKRTMDLTGGILLFYGISSITSIVFLNNNFAPINNVQLLPFLFIILCVLICIYPLYKYRSVFSKCSIIKYRDRNGIMFDFILISIPFIVWAFVEFTMKVYSTNIFSLADVYEDREDQMRGSFLGNVSMNYVRLFDYIWPILFFYCRTQHNKLMKYSWVPLLGTITMCISGYVGASRASVIRELLYFCCVFYLYKNSISKSFKKKFLIVGGVLLSLIIIALFAVTISRYNAGSQNYELFTWISLYTGEGCLRFSQFAWDIDEISYGDTNFSFVKSCMGFDTVTDNDLRRTIYEKKLGIPTNIFYTFIGDFCMDFGKIGTIVFCSLLSFLMLKLLKYTKKQKSWSLLAVFYVAMYITMILYGVMYFFCKTYNQQLRLFESVLFIYLFQNYILIKNVKRKKIFKKYRRQ